MIGKIISHYKIVAELGAGGMGVVYEAEDTKLKRHVALKFLPTDLTRDADMRERFVQEAQAASALEHANICTIHEINETGDGQLYIVMAFYAGETLKERIEREPLGLPAALTVADQIGRGLARAHEAGIVHRDIKPANIIITDRGEVKIVDFGLAKLDSQTQLTKAGVTVGTAAYMSPEQASGAHTDHRADIWALGVVLYQMLTGELPFKGEYDMALMYAILHEAPQPLTQAQPDLPAQLEAIVNRALAKNSDDRYQSIAELLSDLRALREPATTSRPTIAIPATAAEAGNHNLPAQLTAFIGREAELTAVKGLLSEASNRLVTIVAPGGMGKTRLSLEAAGQMIPAFPQGIYFVALDRINSAAQVVQAVAEVLPISLASNEDPKTRVLDYLHDKKIVLLMDNFEHVLDSAAFIEEILQAAPRVQILASSRLQLNLTGETVLKIDGLNVSEDQPEESSANQLFALSARRLLSNFKLNDATLPAVTQICRLVGGMPLAILLAAVWIDTLSVEEIAAEIEKGIDLLETEKRDIPDRQRSVRAVIESSWSQVDAAAQTLLKRLSVFRGGFTRTAAQEAAGASLRGLSQLVDKALLRREPGSGRYSLHELLRQYAEEQLKFSSEEEQAAHESHAKYFADFMKTCETHLHDNRCKSALLEIGADIDNVRVAWNYWTNKQDAQRLLKFIDAMWIFFEIRGSFTPAIQLFGDAAKKLASNEPNIVCFRAQLQARRAWFTALIGLPDEGLLMAQESVNILSHYKQDISVETLESVNINAIFLNENDIVVQTSQKMMARSERSGNIWERGWALIWWAYALVLQRQIDDALHAGQEALATFERSDNPFGLSVASGIVFGAISMATGDIGAAKTHYLRGAQEAEAINYLRLLQITNDNLGTVALMENDVEQAELFFRKSLRISQECGQTREMLASLRDLAGVYLAQGNPEQALQLLAVVLNHPTSGQNSLNRPERLRDEAEKLRAQIQTQLEPSLYESAWESGQRQRLAEVVRDILN